MSEVQPPLRVALAGFGAIGQQIAEALAANTLDGVALTAVSARNRDAAAQRLPEALRDIPVVALDELEPLADVLIECAPASLLKVALEPFLMAGKTAIVLSASALLDQYDALSQLARETGGRLIVPTGALLGLDAVTAAAEGEIRSVRMVTRKPVRGLLGAPYLAEHGIDLGAVDAETKVFEGTAREAATGFPANLNVAAALSLAGIGPDRTIVEIWADPKSVRNRHRIDVESDSAHFSMSIENIPTENPKTGRITALSVLAILRKMTAPIRVGT